MVKFFNQLLNRKKEENTKKKNTKHAPDRNYENHNYYLYIEYDMSQIDENDERKTEKRTFSAFHNANFSGNGFLEIIHPALALHQVRCSRNQITFGVIFELDSHHDMDSDYIPDYDQVVWKKNMDQYDKEKISSLIAASTPHKVKFGDFKQY